MGRFSGMLLASDYDGTLASSEGVISEENKKAIRYFTENGGYFTVCTGRSVQGFHAFDPSLMNAPVINANGAVLYDYKKRQTVFSVDVNDISVLSRILQAFPGVCIEMYTNRFETFVLNLDERSRSHMERQYIVYKTVSSPDEVPLPLVKIMISIGKDRCEALQSFLDSVDLGETRYIPTYGSFVEIHHKNAGKGKGLLKLAERLGVEHSRIFCMGDGSNDVDMLSVAVGLVPSNGSSFAKAAASHIIASNDENAAADAIRLIEELTR